MDNAMTDVQKAIAEKEAGNLAYRARDLQKAGQHYEAAIQLDPTEMRYVTNMAAVLFERGEFRACAELCEKAVSVGRENRASFQDIAKALRRAGCALLKLGELESAKSVLERSLSESRTRETKVLLNEVQRQIEEAKRDPEKAEVENVAGNAAFKEGRFGEAVQRYTAAISNNPRDPRYHCNRAAAYTKLAEFAHARRDADAAIAIDARCVKGWLRRAHAHLGLREQERARADFKQALLVDPANEDARRGLENLAFTQKSSDPEDRLQRAMADPEVCAIMADPAMGAILQQMETDPGALNEHMKNPEVAGKLCKLFEAGVIVARHA